jgi:hypothetical protein
LGKKPIFRDEQSEPTTVIFEYIKSPAFRTIHADGAIGGVTPSGNVHIAFYNERAPIPQKIVHKRKPDGSLGALLKEQTVARPGIIREMDIDVVLSPSALDALIVWLQTRQSDLKKRQDILNKRRKRGRK